MNTRRMRSIVTRSGLIAVLVMGLAATVSAAEGLRFKTRSARHQRGPDADPDGSGKASVWIDVEAGMVCFDISFRDSGTPNRRTHPRRRRCRRRSIVVPFFDIHTAATARSAARGARGEEPDRWLRDGRPGAAGADRREPRRVLREPPQRPLPGRLDARPARRLRDSEGGRATTVAARRSAAWKRAADPRFSGGNGLQEGRCRGFECAGLGLGQRAQRRSHAGSAPGRPRSPRTCLTDAMNCPLASMARAQRRQARAGARAPASSAAAHDVGERGRHARDGADRAARQRRRR